MKPDDWVRAMESEAISVSDVVWVKEMRQTVQRGRLRQMGHTALASLLVFQMMELILPGFYLAGLRSDQFTLMSSASASLLVTGLCFWLGRRGWVLWPMIVVGLLAPVLISTWPSVALGWTSWPEVLVQYSQAAYWRRRLLWLPVQLIFIFAVYLIGQHWPRRGPKT